MNKCYFTQMAARPLVFEKREFRFLITNVVGGRSCGIYETEDAEEQRILDAAVAQRKGVKVISQEEANESKKKATLILQSPKSGGFRPKLERQQINNGPELAMDKAGVVSAGFVAPESEENLLIAPSRDSLIQVRRINSPKPFSGSEQKTQQASKRADKIRTKARTEAIDI